jgi:chemotaxis protein CheX
MNIEFIDPFLRAAYTVMESILGSRPERGQISLRKSSFTTLQVTIMAGVNGEVEGQALYGMSLDTAQKIAGAMMCCEVETMDDMALSAVSDLGNMITGNASTLLSQKGLDVDITPPSVIRGLNIEISTRTAALVVPITTTAGAIEINVALAENQIEKAA